MAGTGTAALAGLLLGTAAAATMLNWNVVKVENFYHDDYSCFAPSCTFMFLNLR